MSPAGFDEAVDKALSEINLRRESTLADVARICGWFSTPEREVYARVECSHGKPVIYFVRGTQQDFLPAFLRRQAT